MKSSRWVSGTGCVKGSQVVRIQAAKPSLPGCVMSFGNHSSKREVARMRSRLVEGFLNRPMAALLGRIINIPERKHCI